MTAELLYAGVGAGSLWSAMWVGQNVRSRWNAWLDSKVSARMQGVDAEEVAVGRLALRTRDLLLPSFEEMASQFAAVAEEEDGYSDRLDRIEILLAEIKATLENRKADGLEEIFGVEMDRAAQWDWRTDEHCQQVAANLRSSLVNLGEPQRKSESKVKELMDQRARPGITFNDLFPVLADPKGKK